jgi:hypothetical protein
MTEDGWLAFSVWLTLSLCGIVGFTYGYCNRINTVSETDQTTPLI